MTTSPHAQTERLIRKSELILMLGISDATIWRMEKAGNFPGRIQLGGNSVAWFESEILDWLKDKAAARLDSKEASRWKRP